MVFRVSIALVALLVLIAGLAPGPFNDLVRLFNDEGVVRAAAQAALVSGAVGHPLARLGLDA